jgi:hypothetical protein
MKAIKIFLGIFLGFVLLLAVALFVFIQNIDSLIEMAIETVGPEVTKTSVEVDRVAVELTRGRGEIHGLAIGNPPGYTSEQLFYMGKLALELDPGTLRNDVVVLREVVVDGAHITAEHKGVADINLRDLLNNMGVEIGDRKDTPTTASANVRFMVEEFSFTNTRLTLISPELGTRELTMKDIHLTNLGDREEGLSAEQLTHAVLRPVIDSARQRAEQELRDRAGDELKDRLRDRLSDDDKQKAESLRSLLNR